MAILEVGVHIGGITDGVATRIRPATSRVRKLLGHHPRARAYDATGRRSTDVIVPRELTRC